MPLQHTRLLQAPVAMQAHLRVQRLVGRDARSLATRLRAQDGRESEKVFQIKLINISIKPKVYAEAVLLHVVEQRGCSLDTRLRAVGSAHGRAGQLSRVGLWREKERYRESHT